MIIKDEKTYNEIEERMEALLAKGTQLGGMDFLSEVEKEELKVLSEAAYEDTETLSLKGISTIFRPANESSPLRRGPLVDIGSLAICTSISEPA